MLLDDEQALALLRDLDDPEALETPRGFRRAEAWQRYEQLAKQLDDAFACSCDVDRHVQDASHLGRIVIPAEATASGEFLVVTVSNFGDLTCLTLGNPGSYDAEEESILFAPEDRLRVHEVLESLAYVAIPEHLLWETYDGQAPLARVPQPHEPSWWIRYFDYL